MHLPPCNPDQVRIGVSIPVPQPFAAELHATRRAVGDRYADLIPPHITVIGPTVVDRSALPAVIEHLAAVAASTPAFHLHLSGTGTFRPISPVVFVNVVEGVSSCERLERAARSGPLATQTRFNYHPHVTIAHEVDDAALDQAFRSMRVFDAEFDVSAIWMYEHGDDGVWRPERSFELQG